jgi:hypothetical protein
LIVFEKWTLTKNLTDPDADDNSSTFFLRKVELIKLKLEPVTISNVLIGIKMKPNISVHYKKGEHITEG